MIKAERCPFCGQIPDVDDPATFRHEVGSRWASVVCCIVGPEIRAGFYTPLEEWRDEAIAAWNQRAAPDAQGEWQPLPDGWHDAQDAFSIYVRGDTVTFHDSDTGYERDWVFEKGERLCRKRIVPVEVQEGSMNLANVIRARWGADWHKERDLIAYDEACNDVLDLLDVIDALQGKPVEVTPMPDWSQLPKSTMWWCVNADGRVAVSDDAEPIAQEGWDTWTFAHGILDGGGLPVRVIIPIGIDWRTLKAQRPAAKEGT